MVSGRGHTAGFQKLKWWQSQHLLPLYLFLSLSAGAACSILLVHKTAWQDLVEQESQSQLLAKNDALLADMETTSQSITAIAHCLAHLAATLPLDSTLVEQTFPQLLQDGDPTSIIAGGGLWPEPRTFDPRRDRRSFFWGRTQNGTLHYYDDYNDPLNPPYTREEWYSPAFIGPEGKAYWSRAYLDPYSLEPMTTCTVPYSRHGKRSGVVTVDVKLSGMAMLTQKLVAQDWGYALLLDRAGRFINAPPVHRDEPFSTRRPQVDVDGAMQTLSGLAAIDTAFAPINRAWKKFKNRDPAFTEPGLTDQWTDYQVQLLAATSNLSATEARYIADDLLDNQGAVRASPAFLEQDPLLGEPSYLTVAEVPGANWILVTAASQRAILAPVTALNKNLLVSFMIPVFLTILGASLWVRFRMTRPMTRMARILAARPDGDHPLEALPVEHQDELGFLAHCFNQHTAKLENAVVEANQAVQSRSLFMANMSHEIRTPLSGVIGAVQLLDNITGSENRHLLNIVQDSSETLLTMLDDILDYAKLEDGKFTLSPAPFDLVRALDGCRSLFDNAAKSHGLVLRFEHDLGPEHWVLGDACRIRQIAMNLLNNALKFTPQGQITLTAKRPDPAADIIALAVIDTGIGISTAHQQRIFQVFNQVDNHFTATGQGTGLGLAVSLKLTHLMGGDLTVESKLGEGSTFRATLNLPATPRPEDRSTEERPDDDQALHGMRILLAEDNPTDRTIIIRMLEQFGCDVQSVSDGEQAWRKATTGTWDVVLMDLKMPFLSGLEATRRIRNLHGPVSRVPIVALTASVVSEVRNQCHLAGMNEFLAKPLRPRELKATLAHIRKQGPVSATEPCPVA